MFVNRPLVNFTLFVLIGVFLIGSFLSVNNEVVVAEKSVNVVASSPQTSPTPVTVLFDTELSSNEVVPPVGSTATGHALIVAAYRPDNPSQSVMQFPLVRYSNLSSNQVSAQLRGPALPGTNGVLIKDLGASGGTTGCIPASCQGTIPNADDIPFTDELLQYLVEGKLYMVIGSENFPDGEIRGRIQLEGFFNIPGDVEGDGKADIGVFRPSNGTWYSINSSDDAFQTKILGGVNDINVSGSYDADKKTDFAVFHQMGSSYPAGTWEILRTTDNTTQTVQWGQMGDFPVRGDFDGDGKNDFAVWRPENGYWYIKHSSDSSFRAVQWGKRGDLPVAGDFDGDLRDDLAIFRPENGAWYVLKSSNNEILTKQWGAPDDIPTVGDYDGDKISDFAVYRPEIGTWYVIKSSAEGINTDPEKFKVLQFGGPNDIPTAADFDGDGKTDFAVFRPENGVWYLQQSRAGFKARQFGQTGDRPLEGFSCFDVKN